MRAKIDLTRGQRSARLPQGHRKTHARQRASARATRGAATDPLIRDATFCLISLNRKGGSVCGPLSAGLRHRSIDE
jgi:hypothetical protein